MEVAPLKIERYFARYEFNVDYVLCGSDCESMSIDELLAFEPDAADQFHRQWLGYTESRGSLSLRREICKIYREIAPEQVLVHTGAEEAIFLFMHAMLTAKDHVIVHWPCYQSLVEVARSIGCEVTLWKAVEENGWALDLDELQQHIQPNTRVIVINTPHNPTGYLMPGDSFQEVSRIAQANNIILFSDEVYRESEYRDEDRLPASCDLGEHAVSLVETAGVLLLPGPVYDDSGNHFRIGFGRKNLPEAIGRLEDFLHRH
jgi:aspartate/methionine/tyrosine aminotransferase